MNLIGKRRSLQASRVGRMASPIVPCLQGVKYFSRMIIVAMLFSLFAIPSQSHAACLDRENPTAAEKAVEGPVEKTVKKSVRSAVKVPAPKIQSATLSSKTSITLEWKPVPHADGYRIYLIINNKESLLSKVKGGDARTYTHRGLTYGKTYRFAIKAYRKMNGRTYKSQGAFVKKRLKAKSKYVKGYKYFYDMDGRRLSDVESFIGKRESYRIKVNILQNVVTVYARDGKKGFRIPVKAFLCSGNIFDRDGTWRLGAKYRYRALYYGVFSQWALVIHGDILFHTVPYKRFANPSSLDASEYNKLGTSASHGCIRMQCAGVKWLYDNCSYSSKVVFYRSSNPGALGKPKLEKIPSWHTWDPTDPTMQWKCKEKGCNHATAC